MSIHSTEADTEQEKWSYLLDLPRPRQRCHQVSEALRQKRSVIWRFPWTANMEVPVRLVLDDCSKSGLRLRSISIDEVNELENFPVSVMAEKLGMRLTGGYDLRTLADTLADVEWDITVIRGLENIGPQAVTRWCEAISELARLAEQRLQQGQRCYRLLVVVAGRAGVGAFRPVPLLREFWYWGWFTSGELRLLAEEMHQGRSQWCDRAWVQAVGVELAGTDPALLFWFNDVGEIPHDGEALLRLLKRYAEEKGWDDRLLHRHIPELARLGAAARGGRIADAPPAELLPLWEAGALNLHPEQGVFLHSAAVAVLEQLEELEHRVWLGQARLLLPLIDRARVEVCRLLWDEFAEWRGGRGGPHDETGGLFVHGAHDEAVGAEFGEIVNFLRKPPASAQVKLNRLGGHVDGLRSARNTLAHYRALNWDAFSRVWDDLEGCRPRLSRNTG